MFIKLRSFSVIILSLFLLNCSGNDNTQISKVDVPNYNPGGEDTEPTPDPDPEDDPNAPKTFWEVPGGAAEISTGCLGRDCIPALQDPEMIAAEAATQLDNDDLVLGLIYQDEVRAYPYRILDWHEIINQSFGSKVISITYCPLTGTAVGIDVSRTRLLAANNLHSFGVSGLLYNNNLIPYDRGTFSNWSQMLLRCVNGPLRGTRMVTYPLIETSWATWKKMFPETKVVSDNTGFDRPYDTFPYGVYKTDPFLLFPIMIDDTRLPRKQRLHGIVADTQNPKAKTYPLTLFENEARAINDEVQGQPVVVAGMKSAQLYISYSRRAKDGTVLTFEIKTENPDIYPFDLVDNEGTVWNVLGEAVSGPRAGEQLTRTKSYNGYWFAFGTFFPNVPIYEN